MLYVYYSNYKRTDEYGGDIHGRLRLTLEVIEEVRKILDDYPDDIVFEPEYEEFDDVSAGNEPYTIEVFDGNYYVVSGVGVEKMMGYTNLEDENGFAFFQRYLREKGIIEALEKKGIKEGDTVRIYDLEFTFYK